MWAGIWSLLTALPAILKLLNGVFKFFQDKLGDHAHEFIADSGEVFERLNKANTADEKAAVARDIRKLLKRL